jgi:hypothetical protein
MFGLIKGLVGAVVKTAVVLPVSIVADVATLGGELTDRRKPYTSDALKGIGKSIQEISDD